MNFLIKIIYKGSVNRLLILKNWKMNWMKDIVFDENEIKFVKKV